MSTSNKNLIQMSSVLNSKKDHQKNLKIGLEIHCQLTSLKTKLFCRCFSDYRTLSPNSNTCQICLGLPGSLPLLNKKAVEFASMICLAFNCKIPEKISFYRKNYFYPDLPKNFQITQYNSYELSSIGYDGFLSYLDDYSLSSITTSPINNSSTDDIVRPKKGIVRIKRIQLEEDPGKIVYEDEKSAVNKYSLMDYNRAGVALVEIVTEPDFFDPLDVRIFLNKITNIFEYLGVTDPKLEGSVRCDVNVSLNDGKKVEIKNISSFKDVEKSIFYEITRQKTLSMHEIEVKSETRNWDEKRKITISSRSKEEEEEYRYFPEPDIPVVILGRNYIDRIKKQMPELPVERFKRYNNSYKISHHNSLILTNNKKLSDFFENAIRIHHSPIEISNWIINEMLSKLNEKEKEKEGAFGTEDMGFLKNVNITPQKVAEIAKLVQEKSINRNIAKDIFNKSLETGKNPSELIKNTNVGKISDVQTIGKLVQEILTSNPHLIDQSKSNSNVVNYILGLIMKSTKGRVDPPITLKIINEKLKK